MVRFSINLYIHVGVPFFPSRAPLPWRFCARTTGVFEAPNGALTLTGEFLSVARPSQGAEGYRSKLHHPTAGFSHFSQVHVSTYHGKAKGN